MRFNRGAYTLPEYYCYPVSYGNEEESSLRYRDHGEVTYDELHRALGIRRKAQLAAGIVTSYGYDSTGGREYIDGVSSTHPERCTPEYTSIPQLAARIKSNEDYFLVEMAKTLVSLRGAPDTVGIHRRVIDSTRSQIGCHDSIGLRNLTGNTVRGTMIGHLLTRSFLTGAGHVTKDGFSFAQKMQRLHTEEGVGFFSSLYRISTEEGTTRYEVRCNDINISDWATWMRVGAAAIALSVGQTPLAEEFEEFVSEHIGWGEGQKEQDVKLRKAARRYNQAPFNEDGSVTDAEALTEAVHYTKRLAEVFMSEAMATHAGRQPKELMEVAKELKEYCEDMERVISGEAHFSIVADRSDWAAKLHAITRKIARDRLQEIKRHLGDQASQRHDLAYDYIEAKRDDKGNVHITKGYGYGLRDRKHFRRTISKRSVAHAATTAPRITRAAVRGRLIRKYRPSRCSWEKITLRNQHTGRPSIVIELTNVRQTGLTPKQHSQLKEAKLR
jgi:hypothetical protein